MNSDEVNWLLQTIEDPENAKRFVQAQYQRGRIPYHVMASLARDRNWTDWPAVAYSKLTGASSVDEKAPDARYGHYEDLLPAWESFGDNL